MRILLIEDDAILRTAVEERLRVEGYAVDATGDGSEGLWLARENPYSLAILDLTLPGVDGLEILRSVRRRGRDVAMIITTARDTIAERIQGLDSGADDYIVKPFSLDELMARVRVQIRRFNGHHDPVLHFGDLQIDQASRTAARGGLQPGRQPNL